MKKNNFLAFLFLTFFSLIHFALAGTGTEETPLYVRFTNRDIQKANLEELIAKINTALNQNYVVDDFEVIEKRDLTGSRFKTFFQKVDGIPVLGTALRIWKTPKAPDAPKNDRELIQLEAHLQKKNVVQKILAQKAKQGLSLQSLMSAYTSEELIDAAKKAVPATSDDATLGASTFNDFFSVKKGFVRVYKIKARRGYHIVTLSLESGKAVDYNYQPFATEDGEFSVMADVYPIYEETEKSHLPQQRVRQELKYIKTTRADTTTDPFAELRKNHYYEFKMDPIKGKNEEGRAQGFWSMEWIRTEAARLRSQLGQVSNTFSTDKTNPVYLSGRYATINIHPRAKEAYGNLPFTLMPSSQFKPDWAETLLEGNLVWEMIPYGSYLGQPLYNDADSLARPARRLADHNPVEYLRDGFDELQVYFAINQLMESLHTMGFTDPELSTNPFHAFLYDPDISMRDNAYYTDDTINFTTYSPGAQNYARDNSTIWHELGHGIMDRLMGNYIRLADTGGLSEGMADFVAALVIADVSQSKPFDGSDEFRIINRTGFSLTNEVHDDGEAYGGAMKDILDAAVAKYGIDGLKKVTDLTLDSMRYTRNHPALTANDWFEHMLFADELGKAGVREKGELRELILKALAGRNFSITGEKVANFQVTYSDGIELKSSGPASRNSPILLTPKADDVVSYDLKAQLTGSSVYSFQYPVEVQVHYNTGALQGAIHWVGEENGPTRYVLNSDADLAQIKLQATGKCDSINREDGSCVDYAYIQVWENGKSRPTGKKRFYLRIKTQP